MERLLIIFILTILVEAFLIMKAFYFGIKIGQKIPEESKIEKPISNPIKGISEGMKEHKVQKEYEKEMSALITSLENIDNYGTSKPQKKID